MRKNGNSNANGNTKPPPTITAKCVGSGHMFCKDKLVYDKILAAEVFYKGRKLEITPYLDSSELQKLHIDINLRKVLVKYLHNDVNDDDLKSAFSIFGEILNAFISSDKKDDSSPYPTNYGMVIFRDRFSAYLALNAKILVKGNPVIVRLHRFRNVGDAAYPVDGKEILAKDLLGVQIGREPKHDISKYLPPSYKKMAKYWEHKREVYEDIFAIDRRKLKKECKRKKDKSLKRILFQMEKEDRKKNKWKGKGAKDSRDTRKDDRTRGKRNVRNNKNQFYHQGENDSSYYLNGKRRQGKFNTNFRNEHTQYQYQQNRDNNKHHKQHHNKPNLVRDRQVEGGYDYNSPSMDRYTSGARIANQHYRRNTHALPYKKLTGYGREANHQPHQNEGCKYPGGDFMPNFQNSLPNVFQNGRADTSSNYLSNIKQSRKKNEQVYQSNQKSYGFTAGSSSDEMYDWSQASGMSIKKRNQIFSNQKLSVPPPGFGKPENQFSHGYVPQGPVIPQPLGVNNSYSTEVDENNFQNLNDTRNFIERPMRMNSSEFKDQIYQNQGGTYKSAKLNRASDRTQFYSEKRQSNRSTSMKRQQFRMPLNQIPEVEEEERANQSRMRLSNTLQFGSTIKKGNIFKNEDLNIEDCSVSSDDLGDEGDIQELRANHNLKSIGKRKVDGMVIQFHGISTEKKISGDGKMTGNKPQTNIITPLKKNNPQFLIQQTQNTPPPEAAVRNLTNTFTAFENGAINLNQNQVTFDEMKKRVGNIQPESNQIQGLLTVEEFKVNDPFNHLSMPRLGLVEKERNRQDSESQIDSVEGNLNCPRYRSLGDHSAHVIGSQDEGSQKRKDSKEADIIPKKGSKSSIFKNRNSKSIVEDDFSPENSIELEQEAPANPTINLVLQKYLQEVKPRPYTKIHNNFDRTYYSNNIYVIADNHSIEFELDEDYYNLLNGLSQVPQRNKTKQPTDHRKRSKSESDKSDIQKFFKNLRYKISYNHHLANLRQNIEPVERISRRLKGRRLNSKSFKSKSFLKSGDLEKLIVIHGMSDKVNLKDCHSVLNLERINKLNQ